MKRLLNTLYVTTQGAYLAKDGETVVVRVEREDRLKLPVHTLGSVVCFGQVSCSPQLLGHLADNDVAVSFLTENGRFLARVQGPVSGNVLLRRRQYRLADDTGAAADVARAVITGKVVNCRSVLRRAARDHPDKVDAPALERAAERLTRTLTLLPSTACLDDLRGLEGEAANAYFGVFDGLILARKDQFTFRERTRRPPLDNVNCLLSFLYTLLAHDCRAALESVGLDPQVGFLHRDRPGRPSLALDLMEEFRPGLADRLALTLINTGRVKPDGFRRMHTGAVLLDDAARKEVLVAYQQRKQETIEHAFLEEKVDVGMLPFAQALLLARYVRGDLDGYPPFVWR